MAPTRGRFPTHAAIWSVFTAILVLPAPARVAQAAGAVRAAGTVQAVPFAWLAAVNLNVPHGVAAPSEPRSHPVSKPRPALLVRISSTRPITARPGGGRTVGQVPSSSPYLHQPTVAWVLETTAGGRFGRVTLPFSGRGDATGWISMNGLSTSHTPYSVHVDLSKHRITVFRLGRALFSFPAATGAPASRTPPGRFFVTDRVSVHAGSAFGSFAFGISGIQTHLPPGWGGGNQLAIHGTNSPSTIGRSVSAGCIRVSEGTLAQLKPLLQPGTPVVIEP
jgi:lipoprotein-anchoring transpeptidase ErfK/SrfK